jgi:hypothetical protein
LLLLGFAATFGAAVSVSVFVTFEVRIVGVRYTVAVGVRCRSVVGIVRECVVSVVRSISVGVRVVRVGTRSVLLGVSQTVAVRISIRIASRVRVEAVGHFPPVWQAVVVGVWVVHVSSCILLLCVGQTIAIPVGTAVIRIQRVGTIGANAGGSCHHYEKQSNQHTLVLCFLHFLFTSKFSLENPLFSLSGERAR